MVFIFAETHRIISRNMASEISRVYNIQLNEKKLLWGSVSPDLYPKYKFHRHYVDESLNFIVGEIISLIFMSRFVVFDDRFDHITNKYFSRKLGIITHYLSDFVCLPHYERWTFSEAMMKHINYESKLNEYAVQHDFKKLGFESLEIRTENGFIKLKSMITDYINQIIEEYAKKQAFENDMNFALELNCKISFFIFEAIHLYNFERSLQKQFVF